MTYYFRTAFNYTGPLGGVKLTANTILDDAAVVYLNGAEILRVRMPAGAVNSLTGVCVTPGSSADNSE